MKRYLSGFISGATLTLLICSLTIGVSAISSRMTIEVDPINVQVNGKVFQPTDANGDAVPVFAYNGTTYAPLRALAEAYGLEVGYDTASNMATVVDPEAKPVDTPAPDTTAKADYSDWSAEDEAAYQEFKGMWKINNDQDPKFIGLKLTGDVSSFFNFADRVGEDKLSSMIVRLDDEVIPTYMERNFIHLDYVLSVDPYSGWTNNWISKEYQFNFSLDALQRP